MMSGGSFSVGYFQFVTEEECLAEEEDHQVCHICGCTYNSPCEAVCYWVEQELCSECVGKEYWQ